jgi:hypothetical protein
MLRLSNGGMDLELLAIIGKDVFLKRLNDNSYIVAKGINIHNDFTCEWDFALGYFFNYDDAFQCFNEKIVSRFSEYAENLK